MASGWNSNVYRNDVDPEQYCGFHVDEAAAAAWIKKQKEGTYEVSTEGPTARKARLAAGEATEEAASD